MDTNNGIVTATAQKNSKAMPRRKYDIAGTHPVSNTGYTGAPQPQNSGAAPAAENPNVTATQGSSAMGNPASQKAPQSSVPQTVYTNKKTTENLYDANGNMGIRQALVNRDVDTSRIGYDTEKGNITIDGVGITSPGYVSGEGVSYADEGAVNELTQQAYAQMGQGNDLVSAAQYSAQSGLSNLVKWDGESGTVSVGGKTINPVYVSDGIAYVKRSEIDSAIQAAREGAGIQGNQSVYDAWAQKYGKEIDKAREDLDNFSYDPNTDRAYQAYMAYQMQKKDKLARDAAARAMDATGGYGGANVGAYAASLYNSQQDIAEAIPQYAEAAYQRARNRYADAMTAGNNDYQKAYAANRDAVGDYQRALDADYSRIQTERAWAQQAMENKSRNYRNAVDDEFYRPEKELQYMYNKGTLRGQNISNNINQLGLEQSRIAAIQSIAAMYGGYPTARGAIDTITGELGITVDGANGERFISLRDMGYGTLPQNPHQDVYGQHYNAAMGSGDAAIDLAWKKMNME